MKANLIKADDGYILYVDNVLYASDVSPYTKLSVKNCQAIERGYDLNELVDEYIVVKPKYREHEHNMSVDAFKAGFQKALELMGDKKFSEEDIHEAYSLGEREDRSGFHDLLHQKQQTEWDVEIEMDAIPADRAPNGWDRFPKLDANGCLILKRI